jgi:hypothetical protein
VLDDEELLGLLAEMLDGEQTVPTGALEAAHLAFSTRRLDEELAELLYDSSDEPALAGMRGSPGRRQVSYKIGELIIDCEVEGRMLVGQVTGQQPDKPVLLDLVDVAGTRTRLDVDGRGRFVALLPGPGPVRLRCRHGRRRDSLTPWLLA